MGGLTHAVHWWEESQLRVLVLTSTVIQFFLVFFPILRRLAIPGWFRFIMWLAYHGGDAVAIYGLATLFNRHKEQGDRSKQLEVVWAPVLLIHLGGCAGVTAYNIEDNELWTRHLLTAVSQVTVAVYVFCKSWPSDGDEFLLRVAIILFTSGILKCFMKAWAFKSASIYSLVTAATKQTNNGRMLYKLEEYVREARYIFVHQPPEDHQEDPGTQHGRESRLFEVVHDTSKLFVDLSSPYHHRIRIFENFSGYREERAYDSVQGGLASAFLLLYTRLRTAIGDVVDDTSFKYSSMKLVAQLLVVSCASVQLLSSIILFHRSRRQAYNGIDVKITAAIFCGTGALEVYSLASLIVSSSNTKSSGEVWPETVAQYSVAGYFVRNKKHSMKMGIASFLQCKSFLDQLWCMEPCFSSARITILILQYLKDGWKYKIQDAASYHSFNNHNSHWGLNMNMPFDECVLLWHLATDFCFFSSSSFPNHKCAFAKTRKTGESLLQLSHMFIAVVAEKITLSVVKYPTRTTSRPECNQESSVCKAVQCRQMSNYMVYLLFVNPEMLLPGCRRNLFKMAYDELNDILRDLDLEDKLEEAAVMGRLIKVMQKKTGKRASEDESFIHQAWDLAERLLKMDEMARWKAIQDVWVQMLCFSASRCRGYLHAKALGKGGEFLSYVWLLLFYMGMETFSERLQRELVPSYHGEFYNYTAPPPTSEVSTSGTTASSASEVHTHAGAAAAPSTSDISMA